ncbi:MAG: hypothetical protein KME06_19060 [Kastovskya adunca ATA6-11-RM4]|jgi:hypothetical protein|nr:hypothetical protein [Kastovskya adunca ATA6-11-RM4]
MTKHYILSLNPHAQYAWDQCSLRDPIAAEHPDFAKLIAEAVEEEAGSFLVAVTIEVKVLEKAATSQPERMAVKKQRQELVA